MSETHKLGADGILEGGTRLNPVSPSDFLLYEQVQQQLSQLQVPVLFHAGNPHERLLIANLDGTGNDMVHNPEHKTNVTLLHRCFDLPRIARDTKRCAA